MSVLSQRMDNDMVIRGLADKTRTAYIGAVRELAKHFHRSPDKISDKEVQAYLLYLIQVRHLAPSSCNVAVNGLRFFYMKTLNHSATEFDIPTARRPHKLPEVLSREEITRLFAVTARPKARAVLALGYGAGLRVSEICHLRIRHIDSEQMTIRVEQGKGNKDRYTLLSRRLHYELRRYWQTCRPRDYLFPARDGLGSMNPSTAQRLYYKAKAQANITKQGGIHSLRHAFATHLLEAGTDIHAEDGVMQKTGSGLPLHTQKKTGSGLQEDGVRSPIAHVKKTGSGLPRKKTGSKEDGVRSPMKTGSGLPLHT